jgi:RNA polymerase sigma factor (sigma-70 family)
VTSGQHPSEAVIAACAAGALRPAASLQVLAHLLACPVCPAKARFFESVGGALLEAEPAAEVAPRALQRALGAIAQPASAPTRASARGRIARKPRTKLLRRDRCLDSWPIEIAEALEPREAEAGGRRDESVYLALLDLPPDQLEVLRLVFVQHRPVAEIAQDLRLPVGAVETRMRRAVQRLHDALEDAA